MKRMTCVWIWVLTALLAAPSLAQGVSEGSGKVVDGEGNPIIGAVVTFYAKSKPEVTYTGKTNKKGRYFVSGMFTAVSREMWRVEIAAEGYVPVDVRVESRTVNRVLVGDPMEAKLSRGKQVPEFPIPPLGKAQVDWTMALESEVQEAAPAGVAGAPGATGGTGGAAQAEPAKDPWVEALTLASAGDFENSVEFFGEAVEAEPENAERREAFAKVLYQLERSEEAETHARKAIALDPALVDAQIMLYSILEGRGDLEHAKSVLQAALEANPANTRILDRLGYVAMKMDDPNGAVEAYRSITEIDPANAEVWMVLANVLVDLGRLEESEAAYQKVVDLDPENAYQTYYNLGALIIKRDDRNDTDTRRAIDAFRRALEIKPDYMLACQELAFALIGIGDRTGALEAMETCVATNPEAPEAGRMKALIASLQK